jgi:hypothetical protein
MRRLATTAVAILAIALLWVASAAAAPRHTHEITRGCMAGRSHVLAADPQAQIYEAPMLLRFPEFLSIYGCSYGHKHSYLLGSAPYGSESGAGGVEKENLVGSIVAYEEVSNRPCCDHWWVVVRDLRNGHILHRVPTGTPMKPEPLSIGIGSVAAIVVKRDGSVAWIVETGEEEGRYQVHAVDKSGSRVLASSPDIDPTSLALAGSTLYWTQSGQPFSASLN